MAVTQDVVLVSSSDEQRRRSLTDALRDRWPVRTASDTTSTIASLDASIAVVVLDGATVALAPGTLDAADAAPSFYQLLWVAPNGDAPGRADAVLDLDVPRETLQTTVERLALRSRYDQLLTTFYDLAAVDDSADRDTTRTTASADELEAIKRELDQVAAQLDDSDAFEIALKTRDDDQASST